MDRTYESRCYCTNLRRSANILTDAYDRALAPAQLTVAQYCLLAHLERLGSANITRWAQAVALERSTMVRNIRLLTGQQLVEQTEGSGKTYTLSPLGRERVAAAAKLWAKAQQEIEAFLGQEDAAALLRIGQKLQRLP